MKISFFESIAFNVEPIKGACQIFVLKRNREEKF